MKVFKNILFVVFFAIGLGAIFLAILADEMVDYYQIRQNQFRAEQVTTKIKVEDEKASQLIKQIESNPQILEKLAPIKLGADPNNPDALNIQLRQSELEAAQKALSKETSKEAHTQIMIPNWLNSCSEPLAKKILFIAGAGLVLISLTCFSENKKTIA